MKKKSFESALEALEKAVENLENGDLSLEDSLRCFEEGVRSLTACQKYIKEAENKVELLLKRQDGTLKTESFDIEND
jgi:exodeoxyribonuclease VII small subunit